MSRGVNKVTLLGNLGDDPEVKVISGDLTVANFRLATSEYRKDEATGESKETTEWHRIVVFGRQAETCAEYLRKGSKVYVEGKIQTRSWEDQNGVKKYMTEIVCNNYIALDKAPSNGGNGNGYTQPQPAQAPPPREEPAQPPTRPYQKYRS